MAINNRRRQTRPRSARRCPSSDRCVRFEPEVLREYVEGQEYLNLFRGQELVHARSDGRANELPGPQHELRVTVRKSQLWNRRWPFPSWS
jgi:hypothetical protein